MQSGSCIGQSFANHSQVNYPQTPNPTHNSPSITHIPAQEVRKSPSIFSSFKNPQSDAPTLPPQSSSPQYSHNSDTHTWWYNHKGSNLASLLKALNSSHLLPTSANMLIKYITPVLIPVVTVD